VWTAGPNLRHYLLVVGGKVIEILATWLGTSAVAARRARGMLAHPHVKGGCRRDIGKRGRCPFGIRNELVAVYRGV
jgi:hypothetical protein